VGSGLLAKKQKDLRKYRLEQSIEIEESSKQEHVKKSTTGHHSNA
jgi:hypothetical protein